MTFTQKNIWYFEKPGAANTPDAARFAIERAKELHLSTVVVASTTGSTAEHFFNAMKGSNLNLIVVSHVMGFAKPGEWEFSQEIADRLRGQDVKIVTGTHALSGLERAISRSPKIGGGSRSDAIAESLRKTVAVGLKVAVECILIAADQGAIGINEEVVAVGGTANGADTVCVIKPANTSNFFDLQVREIVAMPRNR
ncbi:MAG: hypothetical protein CVV34_01910 [Methanomicrobiales archaeon HGW-Methanomicrobiales-5]|jgi:hypothetical protein|nr:MAG: hypothetical protein CVV34_01910 [Methanomicrobiales archaeon HGW-Methanomicrobiales-5]